MKTRLGARAGKKTLEEESKWHPNTKECSVSKGQFGTFGVPNNLALLANGLRVTIRHTLFNLFAKGCIWIHILIVRAYFLESSDLYK